MAGTVPCRTAGIVCSVTTPAAPRSGPSQATPPAALRWAVRLLQAEAVALGLLVVFLIYRDVTGAAAHLTSALLVTAFTIGGAVVLWLLAGALAGCRAGARAPAIVLQLLLLPIGYQLAQSGRPWLGVPLIGLGMLIIGLLVSPPTTRAMGLR